VVREEKVRLWVLGLFAATACAQPDGSQYLPRLGVGETRVYVLLLLRAGTPVMRITVRGEEPRVINGHEYWPEVAAGVPGAAAATTTYYRRGSDGIYARSDTSRSGIEQLVLPIPLRVGASWTWVFSDTTLIFTASAIEHIEVDNRTYKKVLKVVGSGQIRGQQYHVTTYYAPEQGLILKVTEIGGVTVEQRRVPSEVTAGTPLQ
jgi:hypothetical protein